MEKIYNERLKETYYRKKLNNGLEVSVYPMPKKSSVYAIYGANAGSVDRTFLLDGKMTTAPAGTAHFLEHKLFESEQGDAFSLFAKTGASANAFTSFDKTCYLFSASFDVERSLEILLQFVNSPHFTEATVKKEQGIIGQEIKMYLDSADWVLLFGALGCLYKSPAVSDDIAGSVESIAEITPKLLYDCCEAYYRPENMALCIAGNIEPKTVFDLCDRLEKDMKSYQSSVEYVALDEPDEIVSDRFEEKMDVSEKQFCLAFKEISPSRETLTKTLVSCDLLLDIIAGDTSDLYRKMYDEGLINGSFGSEVLFGRGFLCNMFSGDAPEPERVAGLLRDEIERLKKEGIDPERFEETRRAYIGDALVEFDSVEETASNLIYSRFRGAELSDSISIAENLTLAELESTLAGMCRSDMSALATVSPRGEGND